jgi:hypothetical protein
MPAYTVVADFADVACPSPAPTHAVVDLDDTLFHAPRLGGDACADRLAATQASYSGALDLLTRMCEDASQPLVACDATLVAWLQRLGPQRVLFLTARHHFMANGTRAQIRRILGDDWATAAEVVYTNETNKGVALRRWCRDTGRDPAAFAAQAAFIDDKTSNLEAVGAAFPGMPLVHYTGSANARAKLARWCLTHEFDAALRAFIGA